MTQPNIISDEVESFVSQVWREVETFLRETGTGPSMFSKAAASDPNLIRHIREGRRNLTFNMALRLRRYMDGRRPEMQARAGGSE